jgi:hypothetical protein
MMLRQPALGAPDQNLAEYLLQSQGQILLPQTGEDRVPGIPSGLYGADIGGGRKGLWTEMADREISSPQDLLNLMNPQGAAGTDKVDQRNDRSIKLFGSDRWLLLFMGKILVPSRDDVDSSPRPLSSRSVNRRPLNATSAIIELHITISE